MNPIRAWNAFWFGPASARPLGAYRVAFGTLLVANLAFAAFDIDYWFTDAGMLRGTEARQIAGPLRYTPLFWVQDPVSVRLVFAATALAAALFTVGWHTRVMGVLVYLGMLSIHHRNVLTSSGSDGLVMIMTFYMMLSPCGAAFSLDALRAARRRGTAAEPLILPWAQRLVQLQLSLIYFNTAIFKSNGATWLNGTALHFVLNNTEVNRPFLSWLTSYPLAINVMTFGALFVEFALPFLLWFRVSRPWAILAGVGLHSAILLTVNIPIFGEVMVASYLTFLTADEVEVLCRRLDPRNWLASSRRRRHAPPVIPGRVDPGSAFQGPHPGLVVGQLRPDPSTILRD